MRVWLKRIVYGVGALVVLVLAGVATVYAMSEARFRRTYALSAESVTGASDSAAQARGAHIAASIAGCADCHGEGLRGGPVFDASPMGRLVAPNLTRGEGGVGSQLTPEIIERAVRHGIGPDARALRIMPSDDFQHMSDDDMRAVIAYVQHVPPVNNVLAPSRLMFLPRALLVAGAMPLLPAEAMHDSAASPMTVTAAPTAEYGGYLAIVAGCRKCHGAGFSGGKMSFGDPSWGPSANLTRSGNLGTWSEAQFRQTVRTGKRPDGTVLKSPMPWRTVGTMTDDELHAVWLYLQSMPPREFGTH
jgi:mono/diheme cytochrome c family protein